MINKQVNTKIFVHDLFGRRVDENKVALSIFFGCSVFNKIRVEWLLDFHMEIYYK